MIIAIRILSSSLFQISSNKRTNKNLYTCINRNNQSTGRYNISIGASRRFLSFNFILVLTLAFQESLLGIIGSQSYLKTSDFKFLCYEFVLYLYHKNKYILLCCLKK